MSRVTRMNITIETINDAFTEDFQYEIAKILAQVECIDSQILKDSNGNTVGIVEIETE